MGAAVRLENRRRRFALAAGLATVTSLVFAAIVKFEPLPGPAVTAVEEIGEASVAIIAAAACAWAARQATGQMRLGWALMAASAMVWGIGEGAWWAYQASPGVDEPFPSPADVGFLLAAP